MSIPKVLKTLNNPPALAINALLYGNGEMPTRVRLEQRIAWNLFQHLSLAGFESQRVDTGDDIVATKTWKHMMEEIFNLDDAYVIVVHKDAPSSKGHYIRFVFGNGIDCISDWSFNAADSDHFNATMERFEAEVYA